MSELEEVSQLSEDTAGHYEAVLQILEGYKEECVELKGFNEQQKSELNGLQAENEGLKDQLCVLQDEVQMRTDVVDKLHSMMATMPAAVDAKEHSEVIRKAAYFEEQHNETAKLLKPLQNKLHQQEKYISRLETQVSAHTTAARQTQDTISHMTAEVMRTKHKYATDLKHNRQYCRKLLAKTECLNMEKEDIRHRSELQAIRTEEVKAEFIQHAESVVRLKEEQIKLLRSDVQHKDSQLQESKTIIKDMMGSLRDTMEQTTTLRLEKEEVQSKFAEASARVNELESMNETAKDTRKQVRREVQGVLAQAKETEQQWSKDKVKCEELIAKQRSKIQTLTTQKNKLEEAAAEQRGNLKKSTERIQGTTAAIERAFSQICGSPHIEQLEIHIGGGDNLNCRQKLQNMIKAATEATLQALRFKSSSTTATQQLDEVREHCKAIESHAGWLEAEWGACKERKESIEEECKKIREEGFAANKQNRELVASNEVMKDKLAKLENAVAVQNDALNEKDTLGQVATAEVVTLKAELDVAQTSTRQYEEQLEELPLLRERIHELTMEQEALGQDRMSSEKDKETLIKEKEQIYEAKMKHQKNTAKYLAELKKVRSEVAELKKKLETSVKATEQLRKQVLLKDVELKSTTDRLSTLQGSFERKEKELRREEAKREHACREADQTRSEAKELVKELEVIQKNIKAADRSKADVAVEVLKKECAETMAELNEVRAMLREEVEKRAAAEEDLRCLQEARRIKNGNPLSTPTRKLTNAGDKAHYVKQQQNYANSNAGIDTPYAVKYRNFLERSPGAKSTPRRSPSQQTPQRSSPDSSPYLSTPQPGTEPKRLYSNSRFKCDIPTPPKFDANIIAKTKHAAEDCSSVAIVATCL